MVLPKEHVNNAYLDVLGCPGVLRLTAKLPIYMFSRFVCCLFGIYMIIHGKISRCIFSKSVSVGRNIRLVPVECRAAVRV